MSAFMNLYNDVFDTLEASSRINLVEDFNDQYNNMEEENLVNYPVCYVESDGVEWDKNQNDFYDYEKEPQTGIASIKVHVVHKTLKGRTKGVRDNFFDLNNHVVSILQKLQGVPTSNGTYSTLLRTGEEHLTPRQQLRVSIITFESQLTDVFEENTNLISTGVTFTIDLSVDRDDVDDIITLDGDTIITTDGDTVVTII